MSRTPVKIETHVVDAKARLIAHFQDASPNLGAVIEGFSEQAQELEDAFFQLLEERSVDTAIGAQLDILGRIVGVERGGYTDDAFRIRIKAQIKVNLSSGTPEDILGIFELIDALNTFELEQLYPAAYVVHAGFPANAPVTNNDFVSFNRTIHAAGVDAQFHYLTTTAANTFQFSSIATLETSTTQGYADDTAPGTGGELSGVG